MNEQYDRRGFLKAGAAVTAAWAMGREALAGGASDVKPMDKVRIGLVGIGGRGTVLLKILLDLEGVEVKAVCDIIEDRVVKGQNLVTAAGKPKPTGYSRGETDFQRLCETEDLDLVINAVRPWKWHVPISVAAMNCRQARGHRGPRLRDHRGMLAIGRDGGEDAQVLRDPGKLLLLPQRDAGPQYAAKGPVRRAAPLRGGLPALHRRPRHGGPRAGRPRPAPPTPIRRTPSGRSPSGWTSIAATASSISSP